METVNSLTPIGSWNGILVSSGTTQLDNDGSPDKLKLSNLLGGGLFSMLSTSALHLKGDALSRSTTEFLEESIFGSDWIVSDSLSANERESRAIPEPGVGPNSTELDL